MILPEAAPSLPTLSGSPELLGILGGLGTIDPGRQRHLRACLPACVLPRGWHQFDEGLPQLLAGRLSCTFVLIALHSCVSTGRHLRFGCAIIRLSLSACHSWRSSPY